MYCWQESIVDEQGNVRPNALLEVRDADTLELVEIFEDRLGITSRENPFRGRRGFCRFYAPAGRYQITAFDDDLERTWYDVRLGVVLDDMPDITAEVTAIVEAALQPQVDAYLAAIEARPNLQFFTVESDGSSSNLPDGWASVRLSGGRYKVTHRGATLDYNVKLTVWDLSSDRVSSAMMIEKTDNDFTYQVRSIHDEASDTDARVEVEVSGDVAPPPFPYTFVAVNTNGKVETSMDGATWTDGGFVEGSSQSREWAPGCYVESLNRVYTVARNSVVASRARLAYMDENGTWTVFDSNAAGTLSGGATQLAHAPQFGGANGRLYYCYRQSGGTEGGLRYSDDGGATFAEVTWTDGKSTSLMDVNGILVLPDRVVVVANAEPNSNSQRNVYVSTDGLNFTRTLQNVNGGIAVGDGQLHDVPAYSPTHDLIFVFGCSQSSFSPAGFWTMNATATAVNTTLANLPTGNNADSFASIATATAVIAGYSAGTAGTATIQRRSGASFSGITPAGAGYVSRQFAQSEALGGRIVAATNSNAFIYSDDDGLTWTAVTPSGAHTSWRVMVATA